MHKTLKTHFCVIPLPSGQSLLQVLNFYRRTCRHIGFCRFTNIDITSLSALSSIDRYLFFFSDLNASWQKTGLLCPHDHKKHIPVFVSRQRFPVYLLPLIN